MHLCIRNASENMRIYMYICMFVCTQYARMYVKIYVQMCVYVCMRAFVLGVSARHNESTGILQNTYINNAGIFKGILVRN